MADEEIYIARLGAWIARALGETGDFAVDLDTDGLGFQMPDAVAADSAVQGAGSALSDAGGKLRDAADALDDAIVAGDTMKLVGAFLEFAEGIYLFIDSMDDLVDRIRAKAASLPPADASAVQNFVAQMTRKVIDYLIISFLEQERPQIAFLLKLMGLIDWRVIEESGAANEIRHVRKDLRLDRIKNLFDDPAGHLADVYGWGTSAFDPEDIMNSALAFFEEEAAIETGLVGGDAFLEYGPFRWSRDSSVNPPGMLLELSTDVTHSFSERIEFNPVWGMDFESSIGFSGGVEFALRPPIDLSVTPTGGTATGAVSFMINRNESARGFTIIGGNDLIQLTCDNVGVGAGLTVGASTSGAVQIDPELLTELKGLTLSLGSAGSDNFLASLLAGADIEGAFDLGLGWTLSEGLVVRASGSLEIAIPMHQSLGIATLETLYIIVKIRDDGSFALELSAGINGQLGPLIATVERMGVEVTLAFSSGADGNLGPIDLDIGFKPPNGIGLALDAGVVRGGGYLYLDFEKGEYAGALELVFSGFLAVKAIGLISTQMPDGSDGFSLLIVVTAEFGMPIQLGYGFTLIGLGGLMGLNRSMALEELADGVRTGSVENVMFPRDVIANAPQIISDMRRFFPPEEGVFLIGPMAKLGWGTPTLVSASLGIIIEVPPGNIAILGVLKCALPTEDTALLLLQVQFIGALEVDKSRLWFFASLYGSRVLFITIGGDMGLLIAWGNDAEFLISVGGFHPRFNPPPTPFPTPARISLSILNESFARIRVEGYFAVTANTAQFGAAVELYFGVSVFSVDGHLGFDALFQFSPFYFIITFSASMSVNVFGAGLFSVRIRGELEGTTPWHVEGEGSISILFWDIDIPFSHTWGDGADTVLPSIEALPIVQAEFEKLENWLALTPAGGQLSVSLRTIEETAELVLHPVGALRIAQRAVPLDLSIQKIGNQTISDVEKISLVVTAPGLVQRDGVTEQFATSQYRDLDDSSKLSLPAYEKQTAGADVSVTGTDTRTSHAVKRIVLHELHIIDNNFKEHINRFFSIGRTWFTQMLSSNATAKSLLSQAQAKAKVPFDDKIIASSPGYVIANNADNSAWGGAAVFASQAKANDALAAQVKSNPTLAAELHVIPAVEAREAA